MIVTKIVEDDHSAFSKVIAQPLRLLVGHGPEAGLRHVENRIVEERRIVEREDVRAVDARRGECQLAQNLHHVDVGGRIVVHPRRLTPAPTHSPAAVSRFVLHSHEHEPTVVLDVLAEPRQLFRCPAKVAFGKDRRTGSADDHERERDPPSHYFFSSSRIWRVLSARSVAIFSRSPA